MSELVVRLRLFPAAVQQIRRRVIENLLGRLRRGQRRGRQLYGKFCVERHGKSDDVTAPAYQPLIGNT